MELEDPLPMKARLQTLSLVFFSWKMLLEPSAMPAAGLAVRLGSLTPAGKRQASGGTRSVRDHGPGFRVQGWVSGEAAVGTG